MNDGSEKRLFIKALEQVNGISSAKVAHSGFSFISPLVQMTLLVATRKRQFRNFLNSKVHFVWQKGCCYFLIKSPRLLNHLSKNGPWGHPVARREADNPAPIPVSETDRLLRQIFT
ncbi:hypothetical protein Fot_57010 [Forsythia ovata]|uniref:Uncharacterized protein n=1 Tax=Forsythia ovata TaxID=205694 RepID=A0ABD1NX75_9LAMI